MCVRSIRVLNCKPPALSYHIIFFGSVKSFSFPVYSRFPELSVSCLGPSAAEWTGTNVRFGSRFTVHSSSVTSCCVTWVNRRLPHASRFLCERVRCPLPCNVGAPTATHGAWHRGLSESGSWYYPHSPLRRHQISQFNVGSVKRKTHTYTNIIFKEQLFVI